MINLLTRVSLPHATTSWFLLISGFSLLTPFCFFNPNSMLLSLCKCCLIPFHFDFDDWYLQFEFLLLFVCLVGWLVQWEVKWKSIFFVGDVMGSLWLFKIVIWPCFCLPIWEIWLVLCAIECTWSICGDHWLDRRSGLNLWIPWFLCCFRLLGNLKVYFWFNCAV